MLMSATATRIAFVSLATSLACAVAVPASAQLLTRKDLPAAIAMTIAQATIDTCKANGFSVSVTVVGRNGEVIVQVRGDNTGPHTMENSWRKAYTSRTFRIPSGAMDERIKKDPTLSLQYLAGFTSGRGALQIKLGEETIGAVGASGAPGGDKDEACVQAGIDKVKDLLK
jgi:uncharacterized protein GlcG (DUF336 family)